MAHPGVEPCAARNMVGGAGVDPRVCRPVHLRNVHDGAELRTNGGGAVCSEAEDARCRTPVSLCGISVAAGSLRCDGWLVGVQRLMAKAQRRAHWNRDRFAGRALLPLLACTKTGYESGANHGPGAPGGRGKRSIGLFKFLTPIISIAI